MNDFFRRIARKEVAWLAAFLNVLAALSFARMSQGLPSGGPGIVALQLAFSRETFASILQSWGPAGVANYRAMTLWVDSWFPLAYALLLSSLLALMLRRVRSGLHRTNDVLLAVPWSAMLLDWLENALHLVLLRDPHSLSQSLVFVASLAAATKWVLIAAAVGALLWLAMRIARSRRSGQ